MSTPGPTRIAEAEFTALVETVQSLTPEEFAAPTDCDGWTVFDIVAHLTGAAEEAVRPTVMVRHLVAGKTSLRHLPPADALTQQQVADRESRTPAEVIAELAALAPRVPPARARIPRLVRRQHLPDPHAQPTDTLGYLLDVIYTRDVWMHRVDISRAISRPMAVSGVEWEVVEAVVDDLRRGWSGPPFVLELTGLVEGRWPIGETTGDTEIIGVDAVAWCRLMSGRSDETGLATGDSPTRVRLAQHRILF